MPTHVLSTRLIFVVLALVTGGCSGGGRATSMLPSTPSTVTDVARARDATLLASTTAAFTNTAMQSEMPEFAAAFVQSIGVNTHFSWGQYDSRFAEVKNALLSLGVRHIRDGLEHYEPYRSHLLELARAGVRATITTGFSVPMSSVAQYPAYVPGVIEAFEGPNEPNLSSNWIPRVRAYQHQLYRTVKDTPATRSFPVLGPALAGNVNAYASLGDISNDLDYGNMHNYYSGYYPGSGSIAWNMNGARRASGNKPLMTSETGYCTTSANMAIPESVMERYAPRMFLEQLMSGVSRTLEYELIDEGSGSSDIWMNCGLLRTDLSPKPAYYALKSVIAAIADPGAGWFARRALAFSGPADWDVHHKLFQRRDGSYDLAIWLEVSNYNVPGRYEVNVPSRRITLSFADWLRFPRYLRIRPDGSSVAQDVTVTGRSVSLVIADSVSILHITR